MGWSLAHLSTSCLTLTSFLSVLSPQITVFLPFSTNTWHWLHSKPIKLLSNFQQFDIFWPNIQIFPLKKFKWNTQLSEFILHYIILLMNVNFQQLLESVIFDTWRIFFNLFVENMPFNCNEHCRSVWFYCSIRRPSLTQIVTSQTSNFWVNCWIFSIYETRQLHIGNFVFPYSNFNSYYSIEFGNTFYFFLHRTMPRKLGISVLLVLVE